MPSNRRDRRPRSLREILAEWLEQSQRPKPAFQRGAAKPGYKPLTVEALRENELLYDLTSCPLFLGGRLN